MWKQQIIRPPLLRRSLLLCVGLFFLVSFQRSLFFSKVKRLPGTSASPSSSVLEDPEVSWSLCRTFSDQIFLTDPNTGEGVC